MSTFTQMANNWMRQHHESAARGGRRRDSLPYDLENSLEDLKRWFDSDCSLGPRCFGGLNLLHIAFCEWADDHGIAPYTRDEFQAMLRHLDCVIGEVACEVTVSGVAFRSDYKAAWLDRGAATTDERVLKP